jgi:hypothetical protein
MAVEGLTEAVVAAVVVVVLGGASGLTPALRVLRLVRGRSHGHKIPAPVRAPTPVAVERAGAAFGRGLGGAADASGGCERWM